MEREFLGRRLRAAGAALVVAIVGTAAAVPAAAEAPSAYKVTNLVSDQPGVARHRDRSLVNAWGLAALPTSPWWVADNGTNVSTLYLRDGTKVSLTVRVPNAPTGTVANTGSSFVVSNSTGSGPALFLFATEDGKILGWNPGVSLTRARIVVKIGRASCRERV